MSLARAGMMAAMHAWLPLPLHADPDNQPAPFTLIRLLTAWEWSWLAAVPLLAGVVLYLWGVTALRRRGDGWPLSRTLSWLLAMAILAYCMLGPLGVYDNVLFSIHMVQHMALGMIAPVFMSQGTPITLALRTLPGRGRTTLLAVVHSRVARWLLFPGLTTAAMVATPFALYPTGLYEWTMRNDWGHHLMHVWMVSVGCAFFFPLIGADPTPWRVPYPIRIVLFFVTMPFHAFLGTTLMGAKKLVAEDWYLAFDRTWGPSPMADQYLAGGILWATGDFTMLSTLTALFVGWWRESQREAARVDRRLDREEREAARAAVGVAGDRMPPEPGPDHED